LRESESFGLVKGDNRLSWEIPGLGGHMIYRVGLKLESDARRDGELILRTMDWTGAPRFFAMGKSMALTPSLTPWTISTTWIKAFMRTAEQFYPDYTTTFSVSHSGENGVATIGTQDWKNYAVFSTLTLAQQDCAGLVARAGGHRRYYAAVLRDGCAVIEKHRDGEREVLASSPYPYEIDKTYALRFVLKGDRLSLSVDGKEVLEARDGSYASGGAGFLVERGAMLADRFLIEGMEEK